MGPQGESEVPREEKGRIAKLKIHTYTSMCCMYSHLPRFRLCHVIYRVISLGKAAV